MAMLKAIHAQEDREAAEKKAVDVVAKLRDFHATVLHQLGYDHERLSYKYQGLDQRLTGVLPSRSVKEILA